MSAEFIAILSVGAAVASVVAAFGVITVITIERIIARIDVAIARDRAAFRDRQRAYIRCPSRYMHGYCGHQSMYHRFCLSNPL